MSILRRDLSRRQFLAGSLGAAALGLAACSDVHSTGSGSGASITADGELGAKADIGKVTGNLTFAVWGGSDGETKGFQYAKEKFEAANPGAKVTIKTVPYDGFFAGIDRGIKAGTAPDIFRVDYTNIGRYSSNGALLDVTPYFTQDEVDEFLPQFWEAVNYQKVPFGVPHQTDTSGVVYDIDVLKAAGVSSVPTSLEDAWSWEEFADVATKLRSSLGAKQFPFAFNWTKAGAFRWLSWLYQADGRLLTDDLSKCALPSDPGTKALEFTKKFFDEKWVPDTNTIKGSKYSDELFQAKTVAMAFIGDFSIPYLGDKKTGYQGNWGATFMPKDVNAASDLGGNAIVATKNTKDPELAAAFLKFIASEEQMKYFCEQSIELPTRKSLADADLAFVVRPDLVNVFAQQAKAISETVTSEVTVPSFNAINTTLQDKLEQCFTGSASVDDTLQSIATGVDAALA